MIGERMSAISELLAGNHEAARSRIDQALGLSSAEGLATPMEWHAIGLDIMASIILVSVLWVTGLPESAEAIARDTFARATAIGDPGTMAITLADASSALALCLGDWAGAERYAELIDNCVARGAPMEWRLWVQVVRAIVAARRGDAGPGLALATGPLPAKYGHPRYAAPLLELASSLGAAGAKDVARDLADHLHQRFERTGERWLWSEAQRVRGELAEDPAVAERLFELAFAAAEQQGARTLMLRAATSLATRRPDAADTVLRPLLDGFPEGAATQDHRIARTILAARRPA